ncbi:hypothetical protein HanPI659440_Chr15g0616051 [Helianthus annuus]|nr:hypothetical protein HanPI659440_Chr15g0616051 [Helianthus annuus]
MQTGVDSVAVDMKDKKLTVIGDVDPVSVVSKLRKICHADIISVGPAKEPEKKKEEGSGDKKKEEEKKKAEALKAAYLAYQQQQQQAYYQYNNPPYSYSYSYPQQPAAYYQYNNNPPAVTPYYTRVVQDENPNSCVIG